MTPSLSPAAAHLPAAHSTCPNASSSASTPPPPPSPSANHHPAAAAASLASIYASYVVRVHTRHGIKTLSFDMLAAYFTFTAKKAAEDLGISSRTLIRVCRSLGIRRWPYLGFRSEKNVERIRHEAIENLRRKLEKEGTAASPTAVHHPNASSLRGASAKRLLQVKLPHASSGAADHMSPLPGAYQQRLAPLSPAASQTWSVQSIDDLESEDDTDVDMVEVHPASYVSSSPFSTISTASATTAPSLPMPMPMSMPLRTPQSAPSGFQLERRSISPRKSFPVVHCSALAAAAASATCGPYIQRSQQQQQQQQHATGPWTSRTMAPLSNHHQQQQQQQRLSIRHRRATHPFHPGMPSLNLLVDASLLTAFKHDTAREFAVAMPQTPLRAQQQASQCPRMSMRDILSHTAMAA